MSSGLTAMLQIVECAKCGKRFGLFADQVYKCPNCRGKEYYKVRAPKRPTKKELLELAECSYFSQEELIMWNIVLTLEDLTKAIQKAGDGQLCPYSLPSEPMKIASKPKKKKKVTNTRRQKNKK